MAVTISDVAAAAGVSKGTVSLALNGHKGVGEDTRRRILSVAESLGWSPSLMARGLASSRTFAIGLVLERDPKLLGTDPFFAGFIAGIESVLATHEFTLVLAVAHGDAAEAAYRKLAAGRVDGFILTDLRMDDSRIDLLSGFGLPAVTLNRPAIDSPFPAVSLEGSESVKDAVRHLVALGHRRIAHVGGPQGYVHGRARRLAWAEAMVEAGLEPELFVEADFTAEQGASATSALLQRNWPPTAIVYANDIMATAGQSKAQTLGYSVPKDLSVVGYDNAEFAQYLNPPLTTIEADPISWGREAAGLLLSLVGGAQSAPDIVLPAPRLIVRGSSGPAPAVD
ncbi:LacI family DNA-binding transcriptional regulator [Sinomonas sp. ASV486]|uniref:LacI family DNA-binding transcriptional regulator n=1 Tax=Sinomonas sp. ASV486 TaxID=3051170 RepID=UPI0027DCACDA|nr:LacI family DNA-binding transcriptional regulator [Sinomonas sp. ASV486]MDQ4489333.1 LacI family DNA-binding transcriptional regulator [Sinomonas sp. ASV486]